MGGLDITAVREWIVAGGAYIANGPYGILSEVLAVTPKGGFDSSFYWANNTIGLSVYDPQSLVTAGYSHDGHTFAFPITWFEVNDESVNADALYADPSYGPYTAGYFLAGYWQIDDPTGLVQGDASGQAIIVSGQHDGGRVTFMGPMTAFRAGTEGTFRLLSNAIYTGSYVPAAD